MTPLLRLATPSDRWCQAMPDLRDWSDQKREAELRVEYVPKLEFGNEESKFKTLKVTAKAVGKSLGFEFLISNLF